MADFLSDEWFTKGRELFRDLPAQDGVDVRLSFQAEGPGSDRTEWRLVVEGGRVVDWGRGALDDAELVLRWPLEEVRALYLGQRTGTAALEHLRFVERSADGGEVLRLPSPMDLAETEEINELPTVPDATIVVQWTFRDGPFGAVTYWHGFEEGRDNGMGLGNVEDPDCRVEVTFQQMVKVRARESTILEALEEGGKIDGQVGPLMLIAGLLEGEDLMRAEMACGPSGAVLARLGLVARTPEHRAALTALAAETG